jgi:F-type H+-transporting ATPase subunit alpha
MGLHDISNAMANYLNHFYLRTSHTDVLKTIADEGKLSDATDAKLKKIVQDFLATFQG